jgi:hypothetical protein|tara:strand:+ start:423 stop:611 length:189 start_codon:yes stop_codon:yes gene_type:complete
MRLDNLIQQRFLSLTALFVPVTPAGSCCDEPQIPDIGVAPFKSLNYRELFRESDIKRAVALF